MFFLRSTLSELGYISRFDKSHNILSRIRYDDSLINDITPQSGGGNEPLGSRVHQSPGDSTASTQAASSASSPQIDRRYLWRGNRRRNFDVSLIDSALHVFYYVLVYMYRLVMHSYLLLLTGFSI